MPLSVVDPENYEQQFQEKTKLIKTIFKPFITTELQLFRSPPSHYRMRAEFCIWHDNERSYYRMFCHNTKEPYNVNDFPAGSKRICALMPSLINIISQEKILRHRLFQIEFLTTKSDDALITLIYHKQLNSEWEIAANKLQHLLDTAIIGRSRKQKIILKREYVTETLVVNGCAYQYQQVENSFTQPNACINEKMLGWASQCCINNTGDLLELYCGNGNFTCVLANHFVKVLATEISKTSVLSARTNFKINAINNVEIVRLSSEELTQAMNEEREFRRLSHLDLKTYNFSTVFVDPPRAGLDKGTETLIQKFDHILYVSCNPETLKDNLNQICQSHSIEDIALFDQFPYTDHAEVGVYLKRKCNYSA